MVMPPLPQRQSRGQGNVTGTASLHSTFRGGATTHQALADIVAFDSFSPHLTQLRGNCCHSLQAAARVEELKFWTIIFWNLASLVFSLCWEDFTFTGRPAYDVANSVDGSYQYHQMEAIALSVVAFTLRQTRESFDNPSYLVKPPRATNPFEPMPTSPPRRRGGFGRMLASVCRAPGASSAHAAVSGWQINNRSSPSSALLPWPCLRTDNSRVKKKIINEMACTAPVVRRK